MHIPDSALSPTMSLACGAAMLPVWAVAGRRLRAHFGDRQTPLLAVGSAFCFTIMLFNIPAPGGTTVHPVGGALLAALLGPAAAIVGMTVALAIQALFFGDGGILALGANAFTMAFAMPVCGYAVYRLLAGRAAPGSARHSVAVGAGAYVGLNVAALLTAVFLGIQPALFPSASGHPLYFPFGLSVTIPALMSAHLLVAGIAEAAITVAAIRYVAAMGIPLHGSGPVESGSAPGRGSLLWVGLAALVALSPLGLLARGEAWGEWAPGEIQRRMGFVPAGSARVAVHGWGGFNLLPDYLSGGGAIGYLTAAVVGILFVSVAAMLLSRLFLRPMEKNGPEPSDERPSANRPAVPSWLLSEQSAPVAESTRRVRAHGFLERTLESIAQSARDSLAAERFARSDGLLQRLDPRAKVVSALIMIVVAAFSHRFWGLAALAALGLALAAASRIPVAPVARRVWLAVPLFVGLVSLPAMLNVVTPGHPVLVVWPSPFLAITDSGLALVSILMLRTGVAVTFATLLTLSTPWNELLHGLRALFVPRPFLMAAAMTYRYLAVLAAAAADLFAARRSRTVGWLSPVENRRLSGGAVGALFGKTITLTDEVHAAMLSRGWSGDPRTLGCRSLHRFDYACLAATLVVSAAVLGGEFLAWFPA